MNAKNVILFLIVILAIVGGLYLVQDKKQNKELTAHNTQRFKQITKIAQKSSHAGLLEMASAINKYHRIKGHYPNKLIELYPEFIPDKSFISTLEWKYSPENKSYLLQKNVAGEQSFSSIGPNLKLKTGNPKNRIVSAPKTPQNKRFLKKTDIPKPPKIEPDIKTKTTLDELKRVVSSKKVKPVGDLKINNKKKTPKPKQSLSNFKKDLGKDEKFLLSFDDNRFYIWKGKNGFIGFSDTQYPDEKEFSIYRDKGWFEYTDYQNSSIID
jgi:hypothetical protein